MAGVRFRESWCHAQDRQSGQAQAFPPSLVCAGQGACDHATHMSHVTTGREHDTGVQLWIQTHCAIAQSRGDHDPRPTGDCPLNRALGTTKQAHGPTPASPAGPTGGFPHLAAWAVHTPCSSPCPARPRPRPLSAPSPSWCWGPGRRGEGSPAPPCPSLCGRGQVAELCPAASDLRIRPRPCSVAHREDGGGKGRERPAGPG